MPTSNREAGPIDPRVPRVFGRPAYEAIDHTADLAVLARGRTMEELFAHAALGMFAFLVRLETVEPREESWIEASGVDAEECLVAFLQEILFLEEVHRRLYCRFEVETAGPPQARARAWGEPFDPERHDLLTDIKAATYHALAIRHEETREGTLYVARVVLDT